MMRRRFHTETMNWMHNACLVPLYKRMLSSIFFGEFDSVAPASWLRCAQTGRKQHIVFD